MSERYHQMIHGFAGHLREVGGWSLPEKLEGAWLADPWGEFLRCNAGAMAALYDFQGEQCYELSWNQCCNAVAAIVT